MRAGVTPPRRSSKERIRRDYVVAIKLGPTHCRSNRSRGQSRIGHAKPDCPLHQAHEASSLSATHRVQHTVSWLHPDACVATIELYPSRVESSVIGSRDYRHVL